MPLSNFHTTQPDHAEEPLDDNTLDIETITGTIGEWLDMNYDDIPTDIMSHLQTAYHLAVQQL